MEPLQEALLPIFQQTAKKSDQIWIALSGGKDSSALLHASLAVQAQLKASQRVGVVHVEHGLHPHSAEIAGWTEALAQSLGLPYRRFSVSVSLNSPLGIEGEARKQRYAAFETLLKEGGWLLLAHHQSDLAESLLLALKRGAGLRGLSGMPVQRPLGAGTLGRPWLSQPLSAIQDYLQRHQLGYREDPTNAALCYDRNFLRHCILPKLEARWPYWSRKAAQASQLLREAENSLESLSQMALQGTEAFVDPKHGGLSLRKLRPLAPHLRTSLLRAWIDRYGWLPPTEKQTQEIWKQCLETRPSRSPAIDLPEGQLRSYREHLHLIPLRSSLAPPVLPAQPNCWIALPNGQGRVAWSELPAQALPASEGEVSYPVAVVPPDRSPVSLRMLPFHEAQARYPWKARKAFFQAHGFPPWLRSALPFPKEENRPSITRPLWLRWRWWYPPAS